MFSLVVRCVYVITNSHTRKQRDRRQRHDLEDADLIAEEELNHMRDLFADKEAETATLEQCRETAVLIAKRLTAARTPEAVVSESVCCQSFFSL